MSRSTGIMLAVICLLGGLLLGGRVDAVNDILNPQQTSGDTLQSVKDIVNKNFYEQPNKAAADSGALHGYVEGLGDPFSQYLDKEEFQQFSTVTQGSFSGIGVVLNARNGINQVIAKAPAAQAGLKAGDQLISINGKPVATLTPTEVSGLIRGPEASSVKVEYRRGKVVKTVAVKRASIEQPIVRSKKFGDVLYIHLGGFPQQATKRVREALSKHRGIKHVIIDVRGNGGGLVNQAVDISSLFLRRDQPILSSQGRAQAKRVWKAPADGQYKDLSVSMVIDKNSASASEILASAMSEQRGAALIGQKSYGKGVVENLFNLPDGNALKLTIAEYLTSRGKKVQKVGLKPTVPLTDKEIAEDYSQKAIKTAQMASGR